MTKIVFLVTLTTKFLYIIDYKSNFSIIYSTKHQFFNKRVIQKGRQTLKDVYLQKKDESCDIEISDTQYYQQCYHTVIGFS